MSEPDAPSDKAAQIELIVDEMRSVAGIKKNSPSGLVIPITEHDSNMVVATAHSQAVNLPDSEMNAMRQTYADLLRSFHERGGSPCHLKTSEMTRSEIILTEVELGAIFWRMSPSQILTKKPRLIDATNAPQTPIEATPQFDALFKEPSVNLSAIKPENFVCRPMFARGRVTGTAAPGGVGKSLIALYEAASIAMGANPYDGSQITPQRVLYWNLEDTSDVTMRRIAAFCKQFPDQFYEEHLKANLVMAGAELGDLKFAYTDRNAVVINDATVSALVKKITEGNIALAVFDPLASLHAIEENDNSGMDRLAKQGFAKIAREADCAVHIVHHSGKGADRAGDPTDMFRGASAITSAFRVTRAVYRLSKAEALREGIEQVDGTEILQMKFGKQNLVNGRECYPRYFRTQEVIISGEPDDPNRISEAAITWVKPPPPRRVEFENPADAVCRIISEGEYIVAGERSPKWIGIGILSTCNMDAQVNGNGTAMIKAAQREQIDAILLDLEGRDVIRKARKRVGTNMAEVWEVFPLADGPSDQSANCPW